MNYSEQESVLNLCDSYDINGAIDPKYYEKFHVKNGLRRSDGTGVVAGITNICNVHGYMMSEGEMVPIDGELIYRGYNINDIVSNVEKEDRFGFEEVVYLLLFGKLPTKEQLAAFTNHLGQARELPDDFAIDMIFKAPSPNIMNKLARSVLALYSYDSSPEDKNLESELRMAINIIARMPIIMIDAYEAKRRSYENKSMFLHPIRPEENTAQTILSNLRPDRQYTKQEAQLLDTALMLHAEHGGGNNSTFTCRVMTSSGTDAYSAYAAAIGSLKGHRHGGANIKVMQMLQNIEQNVKNWESDSEVADYLTKIMKKEANDGTGLIYGMGHAVYTLSDPRAVILKRKAFEAAKGKEIEAEFRLLERIERLTPEVFKSIKGDRKSVCANVDMYSGLVYKLLGIPLDLYTPLFAISRIAGWSAHRMEERLTCRKIIRPAYKAINKNTEYIPIENR